MSGVALVENAVTRIAFENTFELIAACAAHREATARLHARSQIVMDAAQCAAYIASRTLVRHAGPLIIGCNGGLAGL